MAMEVRKSTEPASFKTRAGIRELAVTYEQTWLRVPFETYEGMTQSQFQDSVAPHVKAGKLVPVEVPRGWNRVESSAPGKHFYIDKESGVINRFPKEQYSCKQGCWIKEDHSVVPQAEVMMDPYLRALVQAGQYDVGSAALKAPPVALAAVPALPATPAPSGPKRPVAVLLPGQGSQYKKMMDGVASLPAVAELLKKADKILGYSLLDLCLKDEGNRLDTTQYCQPAMFVAGAAGVEKLKTEKGADFVDSIQAVAGLSLGEYTALYIAGVFDFETGLELVKLRGEAMQDASVICPQAMISVAGLSKEVLSKLCEDVKTQPSDVCQIANELFPAGFSCAGSLSCVEKLKNLSEKTQGCLQSKLLKTSGGFHTSLMAPAQAKLSAKLKEVESRMRAPRCDVYMNVTGKKITPATPVSEIVDLMGKQLTSPVLWETSVRNMIEDNVTEFYECGPMKQLKAMMKRISTQAFDKTKTIDV